MNEESLKYMMARDDVADILERGHTHEELIAELKEYFELDKEYYEELEMTNEVVQRAIATENN